MGFFILPSLFHVAWVFVSIETAVPWILPHRELYNGTFIPNDAVIITSHGVDLDTVVFENGTHVHHVRNINNGIGQRNAPPPLPNPLPFTGFLSYLYGTGAGGMSEFTLPTSQIVMPDGDLLMTMATTVGAWPGPASGGQPAGTIPTQGIEGFLLRITPDGTTRTCSTFFSGMVGDAFVQGAYDSDANEFVLFALSSSDTTTLAFPDLPAGGIIASVVQPSTTYPLFQPGYLPLIMRMNADTCATVTAMTYLSTPIGDAFGVFPYQDTGTLFPHAQVIVLDDGSVIIGCTVDRGGWPGVRGPDASDAIFKPAIIHLTPTLDDYVATALLGVNAGDPFFGANVQLNSLSYDTNTAVYHLGFTGDHTPAANGQYFVDLVVDPATRLLHDVLSPAFRFSRQCSPPRSDMLKGKIFLDPSNTYGYWFATMQAAAPFPDGPVGTANAIIPDSDATSANSIAYGICRAADAATITQSIFPSADAGNYPFDIELGPTGRVDGALADDTLVFSLMSVTVSPSWPVGATTSYYTTIESDFGDSTAWAEILVSPVASKVGFATYIPNRGMSTLNFAYSPTSTTYLRVLTPVYNQPQDAPLTREGVGLVEGVRVRAARWMQAIVGVPFQTAPPTMPVTDYTVPPAYLVAAPNPATVEAAYFVGMQVCDHYVWDGTAIGTVACVLDGPSTAGGGISGALLAGILMAVLIPVTFVVVAALISYAPTVTVVATPTSSSITARIRARRRDSYL